MHVTCRYYISTTGGFHLCLFFVCLPWSNSFKCLPKRRDQWSNFASGPANRWKIPWGAPKPVWNPKMVRFDLTFRYMIRCTYIYIQIYNMDFVSFRWVNFCQMFKRHRLGPGELSESLPSVFFFQLRIGVMEI